VYSILLNVKRQIYLSRVNHKICQTNIEPLTCVHMPWVQVKVSVGVVMTTSCVVVATVDVGHAPMLQVLVSKGRWVASH